MNFCLPLCGDCFQVLAARHWTRAIERAVVTDGLCSRRISNPVREFRSFFVVHVPCSAPAVLFRVVFQNSRDLGKQGPTGQGHLPMLPLRKSPPVQKLIHVNRSIWDEILLLDEAWRQYCLVEVLVVCPCDAPAHKFEQIENMPLTLVSASVARQYNVHIIAEVIDLYQLRVSYLFLIFSWCFCCGSCVGWKTHER